MNKDEEEIFIAELYNLCENFAYDYGIFDVDTFKESAVFKKIKEYVKSQSTLFKEWQDSNLEDKKWETYDGCDRWINPHTRDVKSTEQLYNIFIEQTK